MEKGEQFGTDSFWGSQEELHQTLGEGPPGTNLKGGRHFVKKENTRNVEETSQKKTSRANQTGRPGSHNAGPWVIPQKVEKRGLQQRDRKRAVTG